MPLITTRIWLMSIIYTDYKSKFIWSSCEKKNTLAKNWHPCIPFSILKYCIIVTCDSIRLHNNLHRVVPSRSAFMFNVCIVFILYIFVEWGLREKGRSEWFSVILLPEQKHRQNKADFLGSFSPYSPFRCTLVLFKYLFVRYLDKPGVRV